MADASFPDKLRDEVAAAATPPSLIDPDDTTEHPTERRAALTAVLKELAHKARITVSSSDSYAELRGICDVTAAVDGFIAEKMAPLTTGADSALAENKQLCGALTLGIQLSTALETWPGGMTALADKGTQIFDDGLSSLVKSELSSYQSASGDYTPLEVQGVCALAWLRPCITEIDLAASLIPPDCVATLIKLLPKRVKTLSLSDTDFAKRGKDLSGVTALCDYLKSDGCGLTGLILKGNNLPNSAGTLLADALEKNTSLTMLVRAPSLQAHLFSQFSFCLHLSLLVPTRFASLVCIRTRRATTLTASSRRSSPSPSSTTRASRSLARSRAPIYAPTGPMTSSISAATA